MCWTSGGRSGQKIALMLQGLLCPPPPLPRPSSCSVVTLLPNPTPTRINAASENHTHVTGPLLIEGLRGTCIRSAGALVVLIVPEIIGSLWSVLFGCDLCCTCHTVWNTHPAFRKASLCLYAAFTIKDNSYFPDTLLCTDNPPQKLVTMAGKLCCL